MKKKLLLAGISLLSLVALVACSGGSSEKKAASDNKATATKEVKSEDLYMTDAEIEEIKTLGDYKDAYKSLMDAYVKDFDSVIEKLPEEDKATIEPQREQLVDMLAEQEKMLEEQFAAIGDDSTEIPEESRDMLLNTVKTSRDMLKEAMKTVREQFKSYLEK